MSTQLFMRRPDLDNLPALPPLPDGLTLRKVQLGDEAALGRLLQAAFQEEWTEDKVRRALTEASDVKAVWVIADANREPGSHIVATASARLLPDAYPDSGYVHWVGASPDYAGKRLGYAVTLAVLEEFVRLGCKDAVLETDDARLPAIRTYLNLGFLPTHRHETHAERWSAIEQNLAAPR